MNKLLTLTASMLIVFVTSNIANAGSINIGVQAGVASLNASGSETASAGTSGDTSVVTASVENRSRLQ